MGSIKRLLLVQPVSLLDWIMCNYFSIKDLKFSTTSLVKIFRLGNQFRSLIIVFLLFICWDLRGCVCGEATDWIAEIIFSPHRNF